MELTAEGSAITSSSGDLGVFPFEEDNCCSITSNSNVSIGDLAAWLKSSRSLLDDPDGQRHSDSAPSIADPFPDDVSRAIHLVDPEIVRHWLTDPDPRFATTAVGVARRRSAWQSLEEIWLEGMKRPVTGRALVRSGAYLDVPEDARVTHPVLTWAGAVSEAHVARDSPSQDDVMRRFLRDSIRLHSQWRQCESADAAVLAGTFWMVAQHCLPGMNGEQPLEAASRTRLAIQDRLEITDADDGTASDLSNAIFSLFSGHLLFASGDFVKALERIRVSRLLGPGYELSWYAAGLEQLCGCVLGASAVKTRLPRVSLRPTPCAGLEHFRDEGRAMGQLALAWHAMEGLRRDEVDQTLASATDIGVGDPVPDIVMGRIRALRESTWGDPEAALALVDATLSRLSTGPAQTVSPLARILLEPIRLALMSKLGAAESVLEAAAGLAPEAQYRVRVAALLWLGRSGEALSLAEEALVFARSFPPARLRLQLLRAAAMSGELQGKRPERERRIARVVSLAGQNEQMLTLALIPPSVRSRLLSVAEGAARGEETAMIRRVEHRLGEVTNDSMPDRAELKLTRREEELLPWLASPDSIPDLAHRLHVSPNTLRNQVVTLRGKLGAATRSELVRMARELKLLR